MKYFSPSHYWIDLLDKIAYIGLTAPFLGQFSIEYVQCPALGSHLVTADPCMTIESAKAAIDVFIPLSGTVVAVQDDIPLMRSSPETVWLLKVDVETIDLTGWMTEEEYRDFLAPIIL